MSLASRLAAARAEGEDGNDDETDETKKAKAEGEDDTDDKVEGNDDDDKVEGEDDDDKAEGDDDDDKAEGEDDDETAEGEDDDETAAKKNMARSAKIARMCNSAGVPTLAAALLEQRATVSQARKMIGHAKLIKGAVQKARAICPSISASRAGQYIKAGMTITEARASLFQIIVAVQSGEISSAQSGGAQGDSGWGAAMRKTFPKRAA